MKQDCSSVFYRALDTFGKFRLIQVSSIATYENKRLQRSDRMVLILKSTIFVDRSSPNRIRSYILLGSWRVGDGVIRFLRNRYRYRYGKTSCTVLYFGILNDFTAEQNQAALKYVVADLEFDMTRHFEIVFMELVDQSARVFQIHRRSLS